MESLQWGVGNLQGFTYTGSTEAFLSTYFVQPQHQISKYCLMGTVLASLQAYPTSSYLR